MQARRDIQRGEYAPRRALELRELLMGTGDKLREYAGRHTPSDIQEQLRAGWPPRFTVSGP
jgi:hypothetical protein